MRSRPLLGQPSGVVLETKVELVPWIFHSLRIERIGDLSPHRVQVLNKFWRRYRLELVGAVG